MTANVADERLREEQKAAVLLFDGRKLPRALRGLPVTGLDRLGEHRRLIVVGSQADLAAVLTALLRAEKLDVEIGFVPGSPAARRRALLGNGATGAADPRRHRRRRSSGRAMWRGADGLLHGEAVVDDTTLFDGDVAGVRIEPTALRCRGCGPRC